MNLFLVSVASLKTGIGRSSRSGCGTGRSRSRAGRIGSLKPVGRGQRVGIACLGQIGCDKERKENDYGLIRQHHDNVNRKRTLIYVDIQLAPNLCLHPLPSLGVTVN